MIQRTERIQKRLEEEFAGRSSVHWRFAEEYASWLDQILEQVDSKTLIEIIQPDVEHEV